MRHRSQVVSRCGHHVGSRWGAWFNTGVLGFRATPNAISIANEWKARMASITGVPGENNWCAAAATAAAAVHSTVRA